MPTPTVAGSTIGTLASTSGTNISLPAGTSVGDLLVLFASSTGNVGISLPGTWELLDSTPTGSTTAHVRSGVWAKVVVASEPAVAVTVAPSGELLYTLYRITGQNVYAPIMDGTTNTGTGATVTFTGLTTTEANVRLLANMSFQIGTASGSSQPSGFTLTVDQGSDLTAHNSSHKDQAAAGATGNFTGSVTSQGPTYPWVAQLVAIRGPGYVPSLTATTGSFTVTAGSASAKFSMPAATASFVLTPGSIAELPGESYSMPAAAGSFTLTPGSIADLVGTTETINYTESTAHLDNPERGFVSVIEIDSAMTYSLWSVAQFNTQRTTNHRTMYWLQLYLNNFISSAIPQAYLDRIATQLSNMRLAGVKCVLRCSYNQDGSTTDATKARILAHIDQLATVWNAYSDVVILVQAGFIGPWGEWWQSANFGSINHGAGTTLGLTTQQWADRKAVVDKLLTVLPTNRMVQLRMPLYKKNMYGNTALADGQAFNLSSIARLGHHNDAFLSSSTDFGTYYDNTKSEYPYLEQETKWLPMGGESAAYSPPRSDGTVAQQELAQFHYTYLNAQYHPDVIAAWQAQGVYDTIKRKLGYRLRLVSAELPTSVASGGVAAISLTLINDGYAAPITKRAVKLVLRNIATSVVYTASFVADTRTWLPGTINVSENVTLPTFPDGDYEMLLHLADETVAQQSNPLYSIQLANVGVWEASTGYNKLNHTVTTEQATLLMLGTTGSVAVTSHDAGFIRALRLTASNTAFNLVPTDVAWRDGHTLAAETATYSVTGIDIILGYPHYDVVTDTEAFDLTAATVEFRRHIRLPAETGEVAVTSVAATFALMLHYDMAAVRARYNVLTPDAILRHSNEGPVTPTPSTDAAGYRYVPDAAPQDVSLEQAIMWVLQELEKVSNVVNNVADGKTITLHAPPSKLIDGMIRKADGTDWNPGTGAGVYVYDGATNAWTKLG